MDDDWGNWDELKDLAEEMVAHEVVEFRNEMVTGFLEDITQPATRKGEQGKTPVDSGRLMAQTKLSYGRVNDDYDQSTDEDGIDTLNKGLMALHSAPVFTKLYIQNNATDEDGNYYAGIADYKGWARTPAYRFFTLSAINMYHRAEEYKQ